ncbi:CueP family metal-binding protein [Sporosarcina oncorhynchi]|uniref:CueP family metal-binding protein n=1 Tax=Sporosarcina oncorhynchi TaxID=3056444 RepID=A0ABZ0L4D0_9BACL|nr:CueP family metal-binding protein [Sporosarcina sp. T2O-4]WOV87020.1 CueP family metal-binding protein [Sporosarcina sp. T2O-4]
MKRKMYVLLVLVLALVVGCSSESGKGETENLNSDEMKKLVHDYTVRNVTAASASITSEELIVTDENKNVTTYKLPEDEFFVSIAPFVNQTHPCDNHSLTGCQGELVEEEFTVQIQDSNGTIILDEKKQTEANGFIDLWLPRNETFTVTISNDQKQAISEIANGDNTCITTMQLS